MIYKNFYIELGNLLYAVAKIDGKIQDKELRKIHEGVAKELVPNEATTDEFGTDSAYYVEMQFETMQEEGADPEDCFTSFIAYIEDHHSAFDDRLKNATILLADSVADAFKGTNKKEQEILMRLKHKIESLQKA
tara:strand:+ start:160 stop:561 length:402 start_codon:yes stop_codon:yes gene_type:complete